MCVIALAIQTLGSSNALATSQHNDAQAEQSKTQHNKAHAERANTPRSAKLATHEGAAHQGASHLKRHTHPGALLMNKHAIKYGKAFALNDQLIGLAQQISTSQSLPKEWVLSQLTHARSIPSVSQLMMPAPVAVQKNWHAYRERFIEPTRIQKGVAFWRRYESALSKAELEFGVPAQIIVGILGVETLYGEHMGAYPVIDALSTLSLEFPKEHPRAVERQSFFQNELGFFLKQQYDRPGHLSTEVLGSYAGAIGAPQFMPSSIAKFAIDYDQDGTIDLIHSPVDAIGSIANYFKMFGWQSGQPIRFEVKLESTPQQLEELLVPDILPSFSAESFALKGVQLNEEDAKYKGLLALIELQNGGEAKTYAAGTENFYVITRYNWSSYYAMAVIELGQAVSALMSKALENK
jgi:membrane-bound lytic murein transglycosylase B